MTQETCLVMKFIKYQPLHSGDHGKISHAVTQAASLLATVATLTPSSAQAQVMSTTGRMRGGVIQSRIQKMAF